MHGCQTDGKGCVVHRAPSERFRRAYRVIITYQYSDEVIDQIIARTDTIMMEDDQRRVLDEEPQNIVEQAAIEGEKYAAAAKRWVDLVYKIDAE